MYLVLKKKRNMQKCQSLRLFGSAKKTVRPSYVEPTALSRATLKAFFCGKQPQRTWQLRRSNPKKCFLYFQTFSRPFEQKQRMRDISGPQKVSCVNQVHHRRSPFGDHRRAEVPWGRNSTRPPPTMASYYSPPRRSTWPQESERRPKGQQTTVNGRVWGGWKPFLFQKTK